MQRPAARRLQGAAAAAAAAARPPGSCRRRSARARWPRIGAVRRLCCVALCTVGRARSHWPAAACPSPYRPPPSPPLSAVREPCRHAPCARSWLRWQSNQHTRRAPRAPYSARPPKRGRRAAIGGCCEGRSAEGERSHAECFFFEGGGGCARRAAANCARAVALALQAAGAAHGGATPRRPLGAQCCNRARARTCARRTDCLGNTRHASRHAACGGRAPAPPHPARLRRALGLGLALLYNCATYARQGCAT